MVLTLTVDNDGALSGELIASISDRLLAAITDPQGGVTTFERSEFVAPDGRTAIGPGGGVVRGPDGIELRVPANAVAQGVELKITPFDATKFPNDPLPEVASDNVHFGGGIRIDAPGKPSFAKEVDLVFKKPADAPEGAFFYVYRRLQGPDGKMAFETLDHATVEGEGAAAKVVTASYPFSGYTNSIGSYSLAGRRRHQQRGVVLRDPDVGVRTGAAGEAVARRHHGQDSAHEVAAWRVRAAVRARRRRLDFRRRRERRGVG